eukprot:678436-Pelagomonas_calceolata.AAC.4
MAARFPAGSLSFSSAGGTAMAAYGELNLSILGLIYMFTSETGEAIRLVMTQVSAPSNNSDESTRALEPPGCMRGCPHC